MKKYKNIDEMKKTMKKIGISEETIKKIQFPDTAGLRNPEPKEIVKLINHIDEFLTEEQRILVMQEQGCCKSGIGPKAHSGFGLEHAEKSIDEKVKLLNIAKIPHKAPCHLNGDGTLSVYWGFGNKGQYRCVCWIVNNLPDKKVPLTFCGCCGGHIRNNYQKSLGVKLQLLDIVSSAASSDGEKQCEFLFKILT